MNRTQDTQSKNMAPQVLSSNLALFIVALTSVVHLSHGEPVSCIVTYWGQNSEEGTLAHTCATGLYGIVNLAYLNVFGGGQTPAINFDGHEITGLSTEIKSCQRLGVKAMLTIGGTGNYTLESPDEASKFGDYLWNNFLGGNVSESAPLGDAILDGIDFYIAQGNKAYYGLLAERLHNLSTVNNKKVYLGATSKRLFPDYWMEDALATGLFNYTWVQYYDEPDFDFESNMETPIENFNQIWKHIDVEQVFFGVPASKGAASSGYIDPDILIHKILPEIKKSPKYGGVMVWNRYYDLNYSEIIFPSVCKDSPITGTITTYWGQHIDDRSLADTCTNSCYGIINLAYLNVFGGGQKPHLGIVHPVTSADIKSCQNLGVKVMLTIGGTGNYTLESPDEAREFGDYLWNNFLGGNVNGSGPLGDVILDGIDFYIAQGNKAYHGVLAERLHNLSTENNKVYLSASHHPDYWMGDVLGTGLINYTWVQYYDEPDCDYEGNIEIPTENFNHSWTRIKVDQVFFGVPACEECESSGYIPQNVVIFELLPEIKKSPKYGGLMVWDSFYDFKLNYSSVICPFVRKSRSPLAAI